MYRFDGRKNPNGTRIAFRTSRDGNQEIYVMNALGANQTRITNNTDSDSEPTWSPDGTRIAFSTVRDGNDEVFVMNANGTNQTNLTNHPLEDFSPS
jgi:TolB protein